jgi:hypothetical protein
MLIFFKKNVHCNAVTEERSRKLRNSKSVFFLFKKVFVWRIVTCFDTIWFKLRTLECSAWPYEVGTIQQSQHVGRIVKTRSTRHCEILSLNYLCLFIIIRIIIIIIVIVIIITSVSDPLNRALFKYKASFAQKSEMLAAQFGAKKTCKSHTQKRLVNHTYTHTHTHMEMEVKHVSRKYIKFPEITSSPCVAKISWIIRAFFSSLENQGCQMFLGATYQKVKKIYQIPTK